ncbi:CTP synthase 2 [Aphelenchoides bicaudatus]|nr:CTP synthase 2 [Aphelenchoides bicaudatus]
MPTSNDNPVGLILVSGSVISGVGKGVITSSLGLLLRSHGYRISVIKIDPYLNIDAGTFSPFEHGEVFVLDDGGEVDLDFGNYERFLNLRFKRNNNITSGKIYHSVTCKERKGDYLGKTVQIVPHITDEIVSWVERVAREPVDGSKDQPHVCIIELGGTIGDIESMIFAKAFGDHFSRPKERHRFMNVHVSMLVGTDAEPQKTKPMQQGMLSIREYGLMPDLLVVRSKNGVNQAMREKIAGFAQLELDQVIDSHDVSSTFRVPMLLEQQGVLKILIDRLGLGAPPQALNTSLTLTFKNWERLVDCMERSNEQIKIALVGKYVSNRDAYFSRIDAEDLVKFSSENAREQREKDQKYEEAWKNLKDCNGILVPGGFGDRGIEGMILACEYARKNKIPFFGICLGMQCAAIEYARNVCNIEQANSAEFQKGLPANKQVVIEMLEHASANQGMGATMRLGRRSTVFLTQNSVLRQLYTRMFKTNAFVEERHRHRYEVNPSIVPILAEKGLFFVGMGVDEKPTLENKDFHVPATESSANLTQYAARSDSSIGFTTESANEALLDKIKTLCNRGGDGVTAAAVRMEIIELQDHPYFVGVQYHPEYLSTPFHPSPPFLGLILAATGNLSSYLEKKFASEIEQLKEGVIFKAESSSDNKLNVNMPFGAQPLFNIGLP